MPLLRDTDPAPRDLLRPSVLLGSLGLSGFAPVMRGTAGTLVCAAAAIGLLFGLTDPQQAWWPLALVSGSLSWVVAGLVLRRFPNMKDPGWFVLDEAGGFFLALALMRADSLLAILAGFLTFRVYDIAKPWPVRTFERIPGSGSLGILTDDLAAGVLAAWTWHTIAIVAQTVW